MSAPGRVVATDGAPAAIGPYVQARVEGELVFCSGQIALDPATGTLVAGGIVAEARRVLENLRAVLRAAGGDLASVVKTTVFLVDMADFAAMNEVYAEFFAAPYPARSTVAVAALPRGPRGSSNEALQACWPPLREGDSAFRPWHSRGGAAEEKSMARACHICGKTRSVGHNVSHANNKTKRVWQPNLQSARAIIAGTVRRILVCTRCLRSGRVTKVSGSRSSQATTA